MKKIIIFLFLFVIAVLSGSCMFYGLTDNVIISKFECRTSADSDIAVTGTNLIVSLPQDPVFGPTNGFSVIDVSNPTTPELMGYFAPDSDDAVKALEVLGDNVFCFSSDSLLIVDISDSANPLLIGEINDISFDQMVVDGDYIYCGSLVVIDISDPTAPVIVSETDFMPVDETVMDPGFDIAFDKSSVYIIVESHVLVIDVKDPVNPVLVNDVTKEDFPLYYPGAAENNEPSEYIAVHDSVAYIAGWGVHSTIAAVDFTVKSSPVISATLNISYMNEMRVFDGSLYIAGGRSNFNRQITIYDLSNPSKPVLISPTGNVADHINGMAVAAEYVYLSSPEYIYLCYRQDGE